MSAFLLGFVTCYVAIAALLLVYGWRCEGGPCCMRGAARDVLCALCFPLAFMGEPEGE